MITRGKPALADIDGTVPGKVQLVAVQLEETLHPRYGFQHSYFEEGGDDAADPWTRAESLYESLVDDWPGTEWAIVGNWRAQYLKWVRRMQGMGFLPEESWSPQAYLDTFKK